MGEVVGRSIGLNCKLELGHYFVVNHNLQGYVTDRDWISKSALDFDDFETFPLIIVHKICDLLNSKDYIVDFHENALCANHITDCEVNILLLLQNFVDTTLIVFFFTL